jgi:ribosomal protein L40E
VTTVTATVDNVGISVAYNVVVRFYDNNQLFASVTYPSIAPGTFADIITTWIADPPLSPDSHSMKVEVDPDNTITEIDDAPAVGYATVYVQNLPDVQVLSDPSLYTTPSEPIVDSECTLNARLANDGDNVALNVPVAFYSVSLDLVAPEYLIGETIVESIATGQIVTVSVPWTPDEVKMYTVSVVVNEDHAVTEISYDNNAASFDILVYDYPDLALSSFSFNAVPTIAGGTSILVRATLSNLEAAPVVNPQVALYVDSTASEPYDVFTYTGVLSNSSAPVTVDFTYEAPIISDTVQYLLIMVANPFGEYDEQTLTNNNVSGLLNVTDVRADLVITSTLINVTYGGVDVDSQMFGRTVSIDFDVENLGSRTAQDIDILVSVRGETGALNYTVDTITDAEVPGGTTVSFQVPWTINLTSPGDYWICVEVDPANAVLEPDDGNNYAEMLFTVQPLSLDVTVTTDDTEYVTDSSVTVTVTVYYLGTVEPVVGVHVRMALYGSSGSIVEATVTPPLTDDPLMTDSNGMITNLLDVPSNLPGGNYYVGVMIQEADYLADSTVSVSGDISGGGIPLMIWIIVILAIVGVVAGFTIYTYVYGLGKLVECGECGAFIPAASKRCPKCGVEFEVGTMKCSECGAWVPADAGECPNCGVKFVGEPGAEDADYLERMKSEYEAMVSEYRELAKEDLGKKFSDKKFEEWWKDQPTYISFDDWLAKEEEKRKEGPMACPVCGTLNPREATVCHKCGTVFAPAEEETPPPEGGVGMPAEQLQQEPPTEQPPQVRRPPEGGAGAAGEPPKMVIRRPIDRKVVPKKIIRQPVDRDKDSEEQ